MKKDHYDRAMRVMVLRELSKLGAALTEIFSFIKPGGMPLVTEAFFDFEKN